MKAIKHLEILGYPVKDLVTGYEGIAVSVSFDLYGCIQVVIVPPSADGDVSSGHWFDIRRVMKTSDEKVMESPNFNKGYVAKGKKGAANKPGHIGFKL